MTKSHVRIEQIRARRALLVDHKDFPGLNKTERQPYPKPKKMDVNNTTTGGGAPNNGKLKEAYIAPNAGNSNYVQNMPAPVNTATKGRVKAKLDKRDMAEPTASLQGEEALDEDIKGWKHAHTDLARYRRDATAAAAPVKLVRLNKTGSESKMHDAASHYKDESDARAKHEYIKSINPGKHVAHHLYVDGKLKEKLGEETIEEAMRGRHGYTVLENPMVSHQRGLDHGLDGKPPKPPANEHEAASYMLGHKAGTKRRMAILQHDRLHDEVITSIDDLNPLFESVLLEFKNAAYKLGRSHGKQGHEMPKKHIEARFGEGTHEHYMSGIKAGEADRKKIETLDLGHMIKIGLATEEIKVGEDDGQEQKKVRGTNTNTKGRVSTVKRKYLGNRRGTTATGKPAHTIDVQPVIGQNDKNANKTTPSGEKKRS